MQEFNPYAAPEAGVTPDRIASDADEGRGVWQDGKVLVMAKVARLPSRCVKCNAPATYRLTRKLSWHSPLLYLMIILPGLLFYAIVALIVRKQVKVEIPICDEHKARRSRAILTAWLMALAGIALCFAPAFGNDERLAIGVLAGIVLLVSGMIYGSLKSQVVAPEKIDKTHAWLKNVSPLYLAELPKLPTYDEWEPPKPKVTFDEL